MEEKGKIRFEKVEFLGVKMTAYVPPEDLWEMYGFPNVPEGYVVAEIADDAPMRMVKLAAE